ncbi:SDR family NAD(P)-dependent oxidoreductase [Streptomyces sp. NPDC046197]|uniref:SDR family NAD(P)-dependent oxidoreductase n=1 Tax=Streptomyces sp. NPDC046197 TaxID=3154337 RepID=UPI00340DA389
MQPGERPADRPGPKPASAAELRTFLRQLLSETCGIAEADLDDTRPLVDHGLTSRAAVGVAGRLERFLNRPLPATLLWENPTVGSLVERLAGSEGPVAGRDQDAPRAQPQPPATEGDDTGSDIAEPSSAPCPVAVIGIGCRLPGNVSGPDAFWKHLIAGSDLIGTVPARRWRDFATGPGAAALMERTTRQGAFLDDIEAFDADHFGITPREAEVMDPQQRLLLEVGCEALDHAGVPAYSLQGSNTGVFVGLSALEYGHLTTSDPTRLTPWTSTGAAGSIAANRLSYLFDLHGPSMTVDTACSSSLVAVHQACRSLRAGECDTALAAGVNVLLSPTVTASFQQAGALAADGRCKPFDAAADGITRGEGCGVVVLKRLTDALRDGDRVLAVIRGTAVNSDGRSAGLMAPNPAAQEGLLRSALDDARVDAADIDYVEAHGTGTLLGDPIEAGSLGAVVGRGRPPHQPLLIGSVKGNIGHLEGAAGIVGLVKTVLALHHHRIPGSLHFHRPNPHIDFDSLGLRVVTEPVAWPDRGTRPARAGVSAFGFGGTNAHVVLEQAPAVEPQNEGQDSHATPAHVLVVSARSRDRIGDVAAGLARLMSADDAPALRDAAHTLARHRRGPVCAAVTARTHEEAAGRLGALARREEGPGCVPAGPDNLVARSPGARRPVLVFSGHGSQWQGMGLGLLRNEPVFEAEVRGLDPVFLAQAGASLHDMLRQAEPGQGVEHIHPLLFGMHIALARTFLAHGVRPAAVIGHSMGEVGAAVIAGALDVADGLRIILERSVRLAGIDNEGTGAMAAVELADEERDELLPRFPGVEIAVHSSPRRCTVAGPVQAVRRLVDELTGQGRTARLLDVGGAGHSAAVEPLVPELYEALRTLRASTADLAWYSTVLEDPRAPVRADAAYWCANLRRPVRLQQAVAAAAADGNDLFLEVSPHPIALIPLTETLQAANAPEAVVVPTLYKGGDEAVDLRGALVRLHFAGAQVDEDRLWPAGTRIPLPSPPWRHERYWFARRGHATGDPGRGHSLLGRRTDDPRTGAVLWQTDLGTDGAHAAVRLLHGRPVLTLPAAASLMIAAAREIHEQDGLDELRLEDLAIHRWLPLASRTPVTVVWEPCGAHATVTVHARTTSGTWTCHASARVHTRPAAAPDIPDTPPAVVSQWSPADHEERPGQSYGELLAAMLYAPAQAGVPDPHDGIVHHGGSARAEVTPAFLQRLHLHHLTAPSTPYTIRAFPSPGAAAEPGVPLAPGHLDGRWDVVATGADARITAQGLQLRPAEHGEVPRPLEALAYDIQWQKAPVPLPAPLDSALLLVDEPATGGNSALATALAQALESRNVRTTTRPLSASPHRLLDDWPQGSRPTAPRAVVLLLDDTNGTSDTGDSSDTNGTSDTGDSSDTNGTSETAESRADALCRATQVARQLAAGPHAQHHPRLWLVTVRARAAVPGERGKPSLACLRGLVRVLAIEEPALRACLVDIDDQFDHVEDLVQELLGNSAEDEVVWRAGTRRVARLTPADLAEQQYEAPFVHRNGAYIVTGGLTGLGLATARRLAEQGAGRLVLNGRRPATPEADEVITGLRELGTSVAVVQGDIAEPDVAPRLVQAALDEGHTLRGVAHCAGVLHDRMITDLGTDDVHTVLRPKVTGALHLEAAVDSHDLDWWVFYSSAAALLGSPGQCAYATANAWLDAIAQRRRAEGKPATSIAWGPWRDIGAAPANPALVLESLTAAEGLDALQALVVHNHTHTGVVHFDSQRVLEAFPGLSDIPFFTDSLRAQDTSVDDWPGPGAVESLGENAADEVYQRLVKRTAAIMGFHVPDLDDAVPLPALGLDSLVAVRIRNAVLQDFAVELPADLMLRGATLREIGETVLGELGLVREADDAPQQGTAASPTASDTGTNTASADLPAAALPSSLQPRDAAERLVAGAWTEVLREPPADVRRHILAADADLRVAEGLVEAIRRRLGEDAELTLTAEAVLKHGTVAAIAELIRPAVNPTGGRVVNTLRPSRQGSSKPPLFTFHPAGGPTSVYQPLTLLLPRDQAVYGLERLETVDTMEEKAARYLSFIRKIQPQGPYRLLGWSFGGCLAYETAQQLTEAGQSVAFLGLIDTILPAALPGVNAQSRELLLERFRRFAAYVEKTYGQHLNLPYDELAATPEDQQIDVVMRVVAEAGLDMSPGIMEHQRTSYIDARVGERYVPRPYRGPVVLYRAKQAQRLTTALDPRYLRPETDLGWAPLCPCLEVVPVEGDHLSLIDPPHVTAIAQHLTQSLAASG